MAFGKRKNRKKDSRPEAAAEQGPDSAEAGQEGAPEGLAAGAGSTPEAAGVPAAQEGSEGRTAQEKSSQGEPPRRKDPEGEAAQGKASQGQDAEEQDAEAAAVADRASQGPFDASERDEEGHYIDLGGLMVRPAPDVNIRIDVDQKRQNVVSVTFQHEGSSLQVQAFAAPKSRGLWPEIRTELAESIRSQSGVADVTDGPLGRQVTAKVPAALPNGGRGFKVARFVGVDGPRWFLRGVISGDAAVKERAARPLEDVFRSLVVVRGEQPMAPRDLLPLRVPQDAVARDAQEGEAGLDVPERGPEITQIG
ncbi:DUF3710 domain-containing protein [Rothia halotolerans]|uniref:DUF3710 domain-containing protein n=1 Tax=Rothia halotolerans TaxID=405770 RepID=UPI00101BAC92|nr:DUF3710 domain-containing protein [Rothia halotolerans]